ncbi:PEP-CTERM sorting domain-containing protein [Aquisphaera insulae]|uniref:PEP-CTERM sorting domain-containing protein n=1 Tax=Aquisphaera insulae TaxID=2712864 RepID=UPI0013E9A0D8|nr:PEP-CTERM sorting domain-containing protein [Aquisphaera insulae]
MQRSRFRFLALVTLALLGSSARAGSMVYDFANYPDVQNGYNISGEITTDGTTGKMTNTSHITSWWFKITDKDGAIAASGSSSIGGFLHFGLLISSGTDTPTMDVTAESIKLKVNTLIQFNYTDPQSGKRSELAWSRNNANNNLQITGIGPDPYSLDSGDTKLLFYYDGPYPGAASPIAVAAVPEPSSLALSICGCLTGLVALARRRQR